MPEEKPLTLASGDAAGLDPQGLLVAPIEADESGCEVWPDKRGGKWLSCLSPTNAAEEALLLGATQKADGLINDRVKEIFAVRWWFAHPVELVKADTGEVRRATRLVLFGPDGESLSTTSGPFVNGWRHVLSIKGNGPYDPPLKVKPFKCKSSTTGHDYLQFRMATELTPAAVPSPTESTEAKRKQRQAS